MNEKAKVTIGADTFESESWAVDLLNHVITKEGTLPQWLEVIWPMNIEELAVMHFLITQWDMDIHAALDDKDSHSIIHGTPYDEESFDEDETAEDDPYDNDFHIFDFAGETWTIYLNH